MRLLGEVLRDAIAPVLNRTPAPLAHRVDGPRWATGYGFGGGGDKLSQMAAYGSVGTLFQVVHALSEDTSRVDWHMHRIRGRRPGRDAAKCEICEKPGVELLEKHPALTRWQEPAPDNLTGQEFVESYQQHIELAGEGYWVMDLVRAGPYSGVLEMWPVRPDRMAPVASAEEFITGWVYRSPDGEFVPLERDQVIPLKSISPLDPYRGEGPVGSIMRDINAAAAGGDWTDAFFRNSALPGGVIEVPTAISPDMFKRLLYQWNAEHRGTSNAHRVAILEAGMKWVDRSYSPKDMILTDLRKYSSDQIRQAFGFPEFASGILENANRASSQASAEWYYKRLIEPRLDKTRDALNFRFLRRWGVTGQNVEFAYGNVVPPDAEMDNLTRKSKSEAYAVLVDAGVAPDDAAAFCGMPPMEARDVVEIMKASRESVAMSRDSEFRRDDDRPGRRRSRGDDDDESGWDDRPADRWMGELDNAMKWMAVEETDENACQPCKDNNGKTYRNRADAYADYPGGEGYVNCLGGDRCRGKVVKRGRKGEGS